MSRNPFLASMGFSISTLLISGSNSKASTVIEERCEVSELLKEAAELESKPWSISRK